MMRTLSIRAVLSGLGRLLEHTLVVGIGFVMMVVGLAFGITMIMLPAGLVIGLLGACLFLAGLFGRLDESRRTL